MEVTKSKSMTRIRIGSFLNKFSIFKKRQQLGADAVALLLTGCIAGQPALGHAHIR